MRRVLAPPGGEARRVDFDAGIVTYGVPDRPPIVFLHGIRLAGRIWEPHARALADEFFVMTPDMPGHGALAGLPFTVPVCEAFMERLAQQLQRPPVIVGYSLGGYVAMRFALAQPERTRGMVLTGCSADIVGKRRAIYELSVGLAAQVPPAAMDRTLAAFFRLTLPRNIAELVIPFPFNHSVFACSRAIAGGVRFSKLLAGYHKPVLIVNGEWDPLFRIDEREFAQACGGRLVVLPCSDHVAPLRQPREFTGLVREFAARAHSTQS
jgi:pimeloyl-ACP methyl ester carboxylesterase